MQRVSFSLSPRAKVHHPTYLLFFLSCFKAPLPHSCCTTWMRRRRLGKRRLGEGEEEEGLSARIIGAEEERRRRAGTDSTLFCADTPLFPLLLHDRSLSRYLPPLHRGEVSCAWDLVPSLLLLYGLRISPPVQVKKSKGGSVGGTELNREGVKRRRGGGCVSPLWGNYLCILLFRPSRLGLLSAPPFPPSP